MRFREALIVFVGISIMVFGFSYFIYRYFFKKDLKNWKLNCFMLIVAFAGVALFLPNTITYVKEKKGFVNNANVQYVSGKKVVSHANAHERLILPTAYDTIENTHPSVISFPEKWNGYKYWMGITAYPKGVATYENPHVFKSNDLIEWIPDDNNPLDEPKSEKFNGEVPLQYDSDTNIIYNKEENRLELFWRYVDDISGDVVIYRIDSSDGKTWSDKKVIHKANRKKGDWISPDFVKDENGYQVWYVANGFKIWHRTSKDGLKWTKPTEVKMAYSNADGMKHWHLDVQKTDLGYETVVSGFKSDGTIQLSQRHVMNVYYSKSKDGKTWDDLTPIIFPSGDKHQFDGKGLYKSALLKDNGQYYVFYSGIGFDDTRGVGLSYGKDIFKLKGLNYSDTTDLLNPNKKSLTTKESSSTAP
ncbi:MULTISPECIES: glycoside hydrolase [Vagococcus]|uniref:Exo-alpha-sialidase n=1 Tax=Vagococcus fluvialis bH819 TaxID=1255619 RepID=A0A1X6WNH0_9ENTE|nr:MULTISPECIES: glycoside hydrolase [Vagococcus]SLM85817.1 hypothetical protein FM121_06930 [Vagococcus fluvialis bH819]HCM90239.1 hypothetical protein [Vagococcus sp.]